MNKGKVKMTKKNKDRVINVKLRWWDWILGFLATALLFILGMITDKLIQGWCK